MDITNSGDLNDDRIFIVEKEGEIKIINSGGTVLPQPFLNIDGRVGSNGGERGLLGLAFDPDYETNGYFFVNYTNTSGNTVISRFSVSGSPNLADENSETIILTVGQPFSNHNAGDLLFGPDGYLYIPLGDGGSGGDPGDRAQNMSLLLGKILRIDVSESSINTPNVDCGSGGQYTIPPSNPFIGVGGTCDEIWASGLRNPWRASFDLVTGDLYLGDVGQGDWEEVDFQPASSTGGENYGWRCYEGDHPYNTTDCLSASAYDGPIFEYPNPESESAAISGGYVYRGMESPGINGIYFFADYALGKFWSLFNDGNIWRHFEQTHLPHLNYSTFGENSTGELFVADYSRGDIYKIQELPQRTYLPVQRKEN